MDLIKEAFSGQEMHKEDFYIIVKQEEDENSQEDQYECVEYLEEDVEHELEGISFKNEYPSEGVEDSNEYKTVCAGDNSQYRIEVFKGDDDDDDFKQVSMKDDDEDEYKPESMDEEDDDDEYRLDDEDDDNDYKDVPTSSQASGFKSRKRKYPPKLPKNFRNKTYKQYSKSKLGEAVKSVVSGCMTCADAARLYGIPKGTLQHKVHESKADTKEDEVKGLINQKHLTLIEDIKKLLKYTNAVPFRTRASRYYCFYCSSDGPFFEDPDDLRSHTAAKHGCERIYSIELYMKPQWMNEVIKLDVEDLHCTECRIPLPDWNKMFVHFAETHRVGFDEAYTKIIPYALSCNFNCVLCHKGFHNYGQLDAHMNQHYSNYICYECGDTFLAATRLDKHLKVHKVGRYPCQLCDKVFTIERYRAKHCALVHRQERNVKCLYCAEKFVDTFHRHKHVCKEHKEKVRTITCEMCGKVFTWKPYFLAHARKQHNGERKHKCQYCSKMFLMQYELKNHIVKHTGEKNFLCLCGDSFNRPALLRKHVQLVHS